LLGWGWGGGGVVWVLRASCFINYYGVGWVVGGGGG